MDENACAKRIIYTEKRVAELWRMGQLRIQIDLTQELGQLKRQSSKLKRRLR
ncbi:4141_t:CDS:2 [Funneliformis caledonium]|uniref:4141_t:CDS:1 n=1 Tax=Funneliformis caledonium TaxID=1117310 RepID=A0A9N9H974_9GLOM|nr:4141_t:CDS:2 [Funneliformis caledonium]